MSHRSPTSSLPLMAAATAALFLAATSPSEAAWPFTWGKQKPAAESSDGSVTLAQAGDADRLNRIEGQMRNLTGQIEELTHQLQVLQDQLKRMQDDANFRFGELEGAAGKTAPAPAQAATAEAPPVLAPPTQPAPAAVAAAPPADTGVQLGAPPQPLGTLVLDAPAAGEKPLDLSSLATGNNLDLPPPTDGNTQVASIAPTGDPRADYNQAYRLVTDGRYDLAESAFRQFLATYPKDELAPDAQYWLGESLYNHDYAAAAEEFKIGYTKYPKAKRAPDMLLKLGLSMAGLGFRDEACKMYALSLKQYPQMPNGLRQRVKTEQASASC